MLIAPFIALAAWAAPLDASTLVHDLLALPDYTARHERLTALLAGDLEDAADIARVSAAAAVLKALNDAGRDDPFVLRTFLTAALSEDEATRRAALDAARSGGDPPMLGAPPAPAPAPVTAAAVAPTPAPETPVPAFPAPAAPVEAAEPALLRQYSNQRLRRGKLETLTVTSTANGATASSFLTWGVYDGGGAPYTAAAFARTVGDDETLKQLDLGWRRAKTWTILSGVATAACLAGGFALLSPGPGKDPKMGGAILAGLGAGGAAVTVMIPLMTHRRHQYVAYYYKPDAADGWIEQYNTGLREKLGLTEQQVLDYDTR